jgi:predicted DNA-binding protein
MATDPNRIHLQIPEPVQKRLKGVQEETGAGTLSEVVRSAIKLYLLAIEEHQKGSEILIRSKTGDLEKVRVFF